MSLQGFSLSKTICLAGYSAALWAAGVATIRYGGSFGARTNLRRTITMVATIPAAFFTVYLTDVLFDLDSQNRVAALAFANGVATILDGIAHTWFPSAYEDPSLQKTNPLAACTFSRHGSGWLLYFVGAVLIIAVYK